MLDRRLLPERGFAGLLERLLAHAIVTWVERGEQFDDYADFERDGHRCSVPGCTARRKHC